MENTRALRKILIERLSYFSAVALLGPRQCGIGATDRLIVHAGERAWILEGRESLANTGDSDQPTHAVPLSALPETLRALCERQFQ